MLSKYQILVQDSVIIKYALRLSPPSPLSQKSIYFPGYSSDQIKAAVRKEVIDGEREAVVNVVLYLSFMDSKISLIKTSVARVQTLRPLNFFYGE